MDHIWYRSNNSYIRKSNGETVDVLTSSLFRIGLDPKSIFDHAFHFFNHSLYQFKSSFPRTNCQNRFCLAIHFTKIATNKVRARVVTQDGILLDVDVAWLIPAFHAA